MPTRKTDTVHRSVLALALLAAIANLGATKGQAPNNLAQLVETERNFARTCAQKGFRLSFYEFYSDDVVTFAPAIEVGKENLKTPDPNLDRVMLAWEPQAGDVAAAADLGWLTGPYVTSDSKGERPQRYGQYLSIWKKLPSGEWRVALDMGVRVPSGSAMGVEFKAWESQAGASAAAAAAEKSDLSKIEDGLAGDLREIGSQRAICKRAAENIRVHRAGMHPVVGKAAACDYLGSEDRKDATKTVATFVSASDDLGYSYGYYQDGNGTPNAYYSRVWKRDSAGKWRIAVDTSLPAQR